MQKHLAMAGAYARHRWRALESRPRDLELCEAFDAQDVPAMRRAVLRAATEIWSSRYRVARGRSTVAGAGLGLFVASGAARAGDGVALYQGRHYSDAREWRGADASYVLNLSAYEGAPRGVIDAKDASARAAPEHCGHLINHPPGGGAAANVAPAPFFWAEVPDRPPINDTFGGGALAGVVFVALSDIKEGEELFLDYRLRWQGGLWRALRTGERGLPPWYP